MNSSIIVQPGTKRDVTSVGYQSHNENDTDYHHMPSRMTAHDVNPLSSIKATPALGGITGNVSPAPFLLDGNDKITLGKLSRESAT